MSRVGYTKAWRKELDSDIWLMPPLYYRVWHFLIQEVSWEDNIFPTSYKFGIHLNPGQGLFSVKNIVDGVSWVERNVTKSPNKKTILDILKWLEFNRMIRRVSNGNGTFITIRNWKTYQAVEKPKVTEGKPAAIPATIPQSVHSKEVKEVKEVKNTNIEYSESFETFWKEYPNKNGKYKAFLSWKKYKCDNGIFDSIMQSLEQQKKSDKWLEEGGRYIPNGSTWVNGRRWEDTVEDQPQTESWDRPS